VCQQWCDLLLGYLLVCGKVGLQSREVLMGMRIRWLQMRQQRMSRDFCLLSYRHETKFRQRLPEIWVEPGAQLHRAGGLDLNRVHHELQIWLLSREFLQEFSRAHLGPCETTEKGDLPDVRFFFLATPSILGGG